MKSTDWILLGFLGLGAYAISQGGKAVDTAARATQPFSDLASGILGFPDAAVSSGADLAKAVQAEYQKYLNDIQFRAQNLGAYIAPQGKTTPTLQQERLIAATTGGTGYFVDVTGKISYIPPEKSMSKAVINVPAKVVPVSSSSSRAPNYSSTSGGSSYAAPPEPKISTSTAAKTPQKVPLKTVYLPKTATQKTYTSGGKIYTYQGTVNGKRVYR